VKAKALAQEILHRLDGIYPLRPGLHFCNSWELLVAVMLSAQTTDEMVNRVTPVLFKLFPRPSLMASAEIPAIETMVRSVNYYKTKARHLHQVAQILTEQYREEVPQSMEELLRLPGVARKTANVVLTHAFGKTEGVVVDTHVIRLSHRLRLSNAAQRDKIEQDLMKLLPKKFWGDFATLLVYHGRKVCKAQKPLCKQCMLSEICPEYLSEKDK